MISFFFLFTIISVFIFLFSNRSLSGKIDVLLFNPPYVPTGDDEVGRRDITAAWAGGKDGVEPLNALLPKINVLFLTLLSLRFLNNLWYFTSLNCI